MRHAKRYRNHEHHRNDRLKTRPAGSDAVGRPLPDAQHGAQPARPKPPMPLHLARLRADPATRRRRTERIIQASALVAALVFVGLMTYLPHMQTLEGRVNPTGAVEDQSDENPYLRLGKAYGGWALGTREDYPFPMHVDASVHWVRSAAMLRDERVRYDDPYTGRPAGGASGLNLDGSIHEQGFHVAFADFQAMTGLPFILIVRFMPTAFAMLAAWGIWAALRPWPGAPIAAAFVALVPSSARFLGMAFFVPIGLGLAWIAIGLLLAKWSARHPGPGMLAVMVGAWSFFIHLIAGFAFLLMFAAAAPLALRERRADLVTTSLAIAAPVAILWGGFQADFQHEISVLEFLPLDFAIFDQAGIPFLTLWALGSALIALRPLPQHARIPLFASTIASMVALGLIVVNLVWDLRLYALYDRWHQPFVLFASIPAAYGLIMIGKGAWLLARWVAAAVRPGQHRIPRWMTSGSIAGLVVSGVVLSVAAGAVAAPGVKGHLDEPYYYFMDYAAWERFNGAAELDDRYEYYLAHPWQAPLYNALTGKFPYTVLHPGEPPVNGRDYTIWVTGGAGNDEVWLAERQISINLAPIPPAGPQWTSIPGDGRALTPEAAQAMYDAYRGQ